MYKAGEVEGLGIHGGICKLQATMTLLEILTLPKVTKAPGVEELSLDSLASPNQFPWLGQNSKQPHKV